MTANSCELLKFDSPHNGSVENKNCDLLLYLLMECKLLYQEKDGVFN